MQWKLPQKLRNDLNNPKLKWIMFINPPFATSQKAGTNHGDSKQGVSDTAVRKMMHNDNLGEVSRELFSQFIYRIKKEFEGKQTHLALFSTLKYINATNDQKLRDNVFNFGFEQGFVFLRRISLEQENHSL
jgi:predicted nucleotidyltransferase